MNELLINYSSFYIIKTQEGHYLLFWRSFLMVITCESHRSSWNLHPPPPSREHDAAETQSQCWFCLVSLQRTWTPWSPCRPRTSWASPSDFLKPPDPKVSLSSERQKHQRVFWTRSHIKGLKDSSLLHMVGNKTWTLTVLVKSHKDPFKKEFETFWNSFSLQLK